MEASGTQFYERPILNSPYEIPSQHWLLDDDGVPTHHIEPRRRPCSFVTPIPPPRRQGGAASQPPLVLDDGLGLSTSSQTYDITGFVNEIRVLVGLWRQIKDSSKWGVTAETQCLLKHWRTHDFSGVRPFFCQTEAVETAIWLTEVAPNEARGARLLETLARANSDANPELFRIALKLATGAGKTTVMAMLIAWQTVNAVRHPQSLRFTRGFLIVTPGITIRDRLRVLQPNDPASYFTSRELVPPEMMGAIRQAKIVITNFHAFQQRETVDISKGGRDLLAGPGGTVNTRETEGQMLARAVRELIDMRRVVVLNDEAHHCYREKPASLSDEGVLKGDDKQEADKNNNAARVWISGIEALKRKVRNLTVFDLSATPFFLKGSGYVEGSLFPWTVSDFSLMDAIECGIVKLPRVPVADNLPSEQIPIYRNLWENIRKDMPKKGRGSGADLNPAGLPPLLLTAIHTLYSDYEKTFAAWEQAGIGVPPCFIVVCQNTAISKLISDYISGYERKVKDGDPEVQNGRLELFRNFDLLGRPLDRPRTLLIDSEQLESGDALTAEFRSIAGDEIERFRRDMIQRTGQSQQAASIPDQVILREVMNTVGKRGELGASIRCVVSVSMLTEGWDANTVTHVLGVRAFGTQLLCEQVIGRALRRQSYALNEQNLFDVEYADVFGIPFDFTANSPITPPPPPPPVTIHVRAMRPDRDTLEIQFPRVTGYRVDLPTEEIRADFTSDATLTLTPVIVGPAITRNEGIIGRGLTLDLSSLGSERRSTVAFHLTEHLMETRWREDGQPFNARLFTRLKYIVDEWMDDHLKCLGGTYPAQLMYKVLADEAAQRITDAITRTFIGERRIIALIDPYNPIGSTASVNFNTSKTDRWQTSAKKCHVNWAMLDSGWEGEFCRVIEEFPGVHSYAKNHNLGFEVPYSHLGDVRAYRPDFIIRIDDGRGPNDLLNLIVEIKGYRGEDAQMKRQTMDTRWVPGVNNNGAFGRWAFAELTDVYAMSDDLADRFRSHLENVVQGEK